ncbi:MAG: transpeptidase family protein [Chitinophagaceae bacterium]|nr:transpeptidase family protein [Chitinophagaceae bacterium]
MDIKRDILWRVHLSFLGIIILGIVIIGRAVYIQRAEGDYWKSLAAKQHLKYIKTDAERGTIFSEDGNMLSTSIPVFDIYIDFGADGLREHDGKRFYKNVDSLSYRLSALFGDASKADYKKRLIDGFRKKLRYYPLKKKISFEDYRQLRDFPLVRLGRNKSGFIAEVRDNRVNPYVLLANRTIGLSRGDTSKNVGLERSYDSVLKGQTGRRLVRYIAGAYIPVDGAEIDPENGKDIETTIDTYTQDVAENALMNMMQENNSLHGTCIVMEVKTGKIKAIANLGRMPDGEYWEDYNYGLGRRTEPGSIFKLATLISLLEDKYVDTGTIVDCEGGQKNFYGLWVRDSHKGTGRISVKEAFAISSNVAFAKMADEFYHNQPQKFIDHLKHFRLNKRSGIDIVGTARPYIKEPSDKTWSKTTIPFMAHGYEELVTPLQMLMLYNAVANDGKIMKPYLVNSISEMGNVVKSFKPEVLVNAICSKETLEKVKACLLDVVEYKHGTAHGLASPYYLFGGKTGTAVSALDNKGYNKANKIYQSAFIGFFPYNNPEYSIAVVIQNGHESRLAYGASVAGPVFKEVADRLYASRMATIPMNKIDVTRDSGFYQVAGRNAELNKIFSRLHYNVQMTGDKQSWDIAYLRNGKAQSVTRQVLSSANMVPDVVGLGLKDALYVLENKGLKVRVNGRGKVAKQSLPQNALFNKGEEITIDLN